MRCLKIKKTKKPKDKFFAEHTDRKGRKYGLRFGRKEDAKVITEIYKEIYKYDYVNPIVYDVESLAQHIENPDNYWIIGVSLPDGEIFGSGVIEKRSDYTCYASKAVIKKKFQGRGLTSFFASQAVLKIFKLPAFKNLVRFDSDTRAIVKNIQKFVENTGSVPYAFIPNYNSWGNRCKWENQGPFLSQLTEPVYLYTKFFSNFWKLRQNQVFLYDAPTIAEFYNTIKKFNRRFKRDSLIYKKKGIIRKKLRIKERAYNGSVLIEGYMDQNKIKEIKDKYRCWSLIEWRVPATKAGIDSQRLALRHGFPVTGYDPGSFHFKGNLLDTVIFCYFPNGLILNQFDRIQCTRKSKKLVDKLMENLLLHPKSYYKINIEYYDLPEANY